MNGTSILIKYSNENRYKFQQYAEFLNFIGYMVSEYLKEDSDSEKLDKYTFDVELDLDFYDDTEIKDELNNWFQCSKTELQKLKDVFLRWNLFQASLTLQYFDTDDSFVATAGQLFKSASDELDEFYIKKKSYIDFGFEYYYARLYCKQKANLSCFLCKNALFYSTKELIKQCNIFNVLYPENEKIYVLMGMIYENSKLERVPAINAYAYAKELIGKKPYVSNVLYRIARICEGIDGFIELMNDAYENAYDIMPDYHNIYQIARQYMEMEIYGYAIEYFQECIDKIENRKEGYLSPLEQKYLFKANVNLTYISIRNCQYFEAIEYASTAFNIKKRIRQEKENPEGFNKFCYEIYQNNEIQDILNIINVELDIMDDSNLVKYFLIAYEKIGQLDIGKKILEQMLK